MMPNPPERFVCFECECDTISGDTPCLNCQARAQRTRLFHLYFQLTLRTGTLEERAVAFRVLYEHEQGLTVEPYEEALWN